MLFLIRIFSQRMKRMIAQMAEAEGINEKLKASDQLGWISQMNSIRSQAEEIVLQEIIYWCDSKREKQG